MQISYLDDDPISKSQLGSNRKYYISYNLGGEIEGKTDILSPGTQSWTINHEATVNQVSLF